jgi:circadian clock protein KaiB
LLRFSGTEQNWVKVRQTSADTKITLYLFVAGTIRKNSDLEQIIRGVCEENFGNQHELIVVDVRERPALAKEWQVVAVPALVVIRPGPIRRIVGDLTDRTNLLTRLEAGPSCGEVTCPIGPSATRPAPSADETQAANRSARQSAVVISPRPQSAREFPTAS